MIAGLLQMQISSEGDDRTAAILHDAVVRLLNFAEIHAQLSLFGLGEVDVLEATRRIAEITRRVFSAAQVEMTVEGEAMRYPSAAVTAISIAVNELITNAIKYGAPNEEGRRRVDVQLGKEGERLRLAVWNAGNPVSPEFDSGGQLGMGLRLVRDLASQHGGALSLRPWEGGTLAEVLVNDASLRRSG
jgi:two-component sensor histidine kinase